MTHDETMSAQEKDDAVIMVCQNNVAQQVTIDGLNNTAEILLGIKEEEIIGKPLHTIMSGGVIDDIRNDITFDSLGDDLSDVLHRIKKFHIIDANDETIQVESKIFTTATSDDKMHYEILLKHALQEDILVKRDNIQEDDRIAQIKDPKISLGNNLHTTVNALISNNIQGTLLLMDFDQILSSQNKNSLLEKILQNSIERIHKEKDGIFKHDNSRIIVAMTSYPPHHINSFIQELHTAISTLILSSSQIGALGEHITISIGVVVCDPSSSYEIILQDLEEALSYAQKNGGNQVWYHHTLTK